MKRNSEEIFYGTQIKYLCVDCMVYIIKQEETQNIQKNSGYKYVSGQYSIIFDKIVSETITLNIS